MISSGCDDIPTEVETPSQCRRRRAVVTRGFVPLAASAPVPFSSSSQERSRELLEEAFANGMYHIRCEYFVVFVDCSSFLVLVVSDNFSNDPVATPVITTGHQLVTLSRSICVKERAEFQELLMSSNYCRRTIHVGSLVCVHRLLRKPQSFLLPHLQEGFVCHDPRSTRDLAPLSGDEALSTGSASSFTDSGLACA